jgi:hypothetical protein
MSTKITGIHELALSTKSSTKLRTNERNNRKKHSDWALHENTVIGRGLT